MIAKWEKKGEHSYKGFIYFPEENKRSNNKKKQNDKGENEDESEVSSWWNPLSWFYYN